MNLLSQDGFVIFIEGKRDNGKTNMAMLLNEISFIYKLRKIFSTNIYTECYYMKQITNYPDLEKWLDTEPGKKTYTLDEAGKHIKKLRFMSEKNTRIMDLLQLIRHYDAGFIGIAPSASFIDSNFMNTDILDARIRKLNRTHAKVTDYFNDDVYFLNDIPKTSISHKSKDIAEFSMERTMPSDGEALCCQIARLYLMDQNYMRIGKNFNMTAEEVKRELVKHLKHINVHTSHTLQEV
jgi:hypothetical protein